MDERTKTNWLQAPQDTVVCGCAGVDKRTLVRAIAGGAETLDALMEATGAGQGDECAARNPRGRCCRPDLQEILDVYVPAGAQMRRGCSCGGGSCCG